MHLLHFVFRPSLRRCSAPLIQNLHQGVVKRWQAPLMRSFATIRCFDGRKRIDGGSSRSSSIAVATFQLWSITGRHFSSSPAAAHGHLTPPKPGEEIHVTFVDKEGEEHTYEVAKGDNLLDIAQANDLDMEGACGGSCACSTCHVIVEDMDMYERMPEPDDEENDMLDLAFGLTESSRLGCQVKMTPELDGLRVKLPTMTRNLQQSDFGKR